MPDIGPDDSLAMKMGAIKEAMRARRGVLVAFSGGVDSGLVAKLAYDALGTRALAVTAHSESLPGWELKETEKFAREIGIRHKVIRYSELENEDYRMNPVTRCYYCRRDLARVLWPVAHEENMDTIADGINISDFSEHRPGIKAMDEEGFWHPFVEFSMVKGQVRQMAKHLGLSIFDKPSMACLSSRIPHGEEITFQKLRRIEEAEAVVRALGFRQVRVRHHDGIARIEVYKEEIPRLVEHKVSIVIGKKLRELGFSRVTIDLQGYRSGIMDEIF